MTICQQKISNNHVGIPSFYSYLIFLQIVSPYQINQSPPCQIKKFKKQKLTAKCPFSSIQPWKLVCLAMEKKAKLRAEKSAIVSLPPEATCDHFVPWISSMQQYHIAHFLATSPKVGLTFPCISG